MSLSFRNATRSDAVSLSSLAMRAKASWGYPEQWLEEWRPQLTFSGSYIESNSVIVALASESIVGVVALEDGTVPEIGHFWVAPEHQGSGVGRKLMNHALATAAARGWTALRIESDPHAVAFYQRFGAELVGEVAAPVCGVDRVLPVLRLKVRARA